ncbi:methyltransferase domain-containing protein [Acidimicrobiia bacterium EGI L10123]|uniref:methyltransferase domain-containing protein n=1 Tax=Salinilacustrithrix flava TaxID=2957203 RepID=UPI003D7C271D|nr:methyltransferase domain-containing protein [Acidimicrobiia bacterium EGI L10123]
MSEATTSPDLLFQDEIRAAVRDAYRALPAGAGRSVTDRFYDRPELDGLPASALDWALGVGNPVAHAALQRGEVVLDVGCGGGIDTLLAARAVGPTGRVIGLDTVPEMCERAERSIRDAGLDDRCEVHVGDMEAVPLPDGGIDVIISNGALNLSPRKSRAIAEMARVLRPGGRLCMADLVVDRELPPAVLASDAAWAGCIAGAVSERVLRRKLERRGFADVTIEHGTPFSVDDVAAYPLFPADVIDLMHRLLPPDEQGEVATGVVIRATLAGMPSRAEVDGSGVVSLADVAPASAEAPGVTVRPLKQVEDVHLKVLDVEPGGSTPFHTHVHAHEGVVMTGRGALRLADGRHPLAPGDVFTVTPNAVHAIEADDDEPLRFACMDCFVE